MKDMLLSKYHLHGRNKVTPFAEQRRSREIFSEKGVKQKATEDTRWFIDLLSSILQQLASVLCTTLEYGGEGGRRRRAFQTWILDKIRRPVTVTGVFVVFLSVCRKFLVYHLVKRFCLDVVKNTRIPNATAGCRTHVTQAVAGHYTDWATTTHSSHVTRSDPEYFLTHSLTFTSARRHYIRLALVIVTAVKCLFTG
jgi:hypothetical protein